MTTHQDRADWEHLYHDDVWQLNLKRLKWRCLVPESLGACTLPWPSPWQCLCLL